VLYYSYLSNLERLIIDEKENYILAKNKFSRNREMVFYDFVYYILLNKGKISVLKIDEYFELRFGEDRVPVSKQNFSQQKSI